MKLVLKNVKGNYKEIILGPLFKLFEAVLELLVPLVMANIIDIGINGGNKNYILKNGGLLIIIGILGFGAAMVCQYYAAVAGGQFGKRLRAQLYNKVLSLSAADIAPFGAGGLITRLTNDVNQVQNGLNMTIRLGARGPFLLIGSIVMAFIVNPKIALIFLVSTPVVMLIIYFIMRCSLPGFSKIQQSQDNLSKLSSENLSGTRVIRAFSRQEDEKENFNSSAVELSNLMIKVGRLSALLNPLTSTVIYAAICFIIWFGSKFAYNGLIANGEIIALVSYMTQSLLALTVAANLTVLFTRAIASAKRIEEVLEINPDIQDGKGACGIDGSAAVEFKNVDFAYYSGAENALNNICFKLQRGETIGIIGGTGSGKSTIATLICRFYDVSNGEILINGENIKNYTLEQLRKSIGFVAQKKSLISGTIRHNMLMAKNTASDKEIWDALKVAQAFDFVNQKEGKLDFIIEEGGKNLSGGQRQRLTIARALLKKPEILILDDSSSALDYATDACLRKELLAFGKENQMSTIIISQRAAGIKHANNILVLDESYIVSSGTHEELLKSCDIYKEICSSQGL